MENITGNARTMTKPIPFFNTSINKLYNLSVPYPQYIGKYILYRDIVCGHQVMQKEVCNSITAGTEDGTKI